MIQLRTGARFMYVLFTMIYHCFIGLLGWCLCLGLVIIVKIAIRQIFAILAQYSHFLARYTLARATQISFSIVGSAQIDRRATPSISKWDSVSGARRRAPLFCGFFSIEKIYFFRFTRFFFLFVFDAQREILFSLWATSHKKKSTPRSLKKIFLLDFFIFWKIDPSKELRKLCVA